MLDDLDGWVDQCWCDNFSTPVQKITAETIVMLWSGASHQVTTLKAAWGKSWEEIERHKMVGPVDPKNGPKWYPLVN